MFSSVSIHIRFNNPANIHYFPGNVFININPAKGRFKASPVPQSNPLKISPVTWPYENDSIIMFLCDHSESIGCNLTGIHITGMGRNNTNNIFFKIRLQ